MWERVGAGVGMGADVFFVCFFRLFLFFPVLSFKFLCFLFFFLFLGLGFFFLGFFDFGIFCFQSVFQKLERFKSIQQIEKYSKE